MNVVLKVNAVILVLLEPNILVSAELSHGEYKAELHFVNSFSSLAAN